MSQIDIDNLRQEEIRVAKDFLKQNIVSNFRRVDTHIQVAYLLDHCDQYDLWLEDDIGINADDLLDIVIRGFKIAAGIYRSQDNYVEADIITRRCEQIQDYFAFYLDRNVPIHQVELFEYFDKHFRNLFKHPANLFND
jgi:hypothetical protein